jgi:hypothetical protein
MTFGGPCRIRTDDLRIKRKVLRPPNSYVYFRRSSGKTQAEQGSESGPTLLRQDLDHGFLRFALLAGFHQTTHL